MRRSSGAVSPGSLRYISRGGPTGSLRLSSGDVIVLGGAARLAFHGVDRLYPGTSTLLAGWFPHGGRVALGNDTGADNRQAKIRHRS